MHNVLRTYATVTHLKGRKQRPWGKGWQFRRMGGRLESVFPNSGQSSKGKMPPEVESWGLRGTELWGGRGGGDCAFSKLPIFMFEGFEVKNDHEIKCPLLGFCDCLCMTSLIAFVISTIAQLFSNLVPEHAHSTLQLQAPLLSPCKTVLTCN